MRSLKPDSIYNLYKQKPFTSDKDIDRFQGLITYFNIHGKPYQLTVETNVEESHETILSITLVTMLFFGHLLFGFILINKRISAKLWQPFYLGLAIVKEICAQHGWGIVYQVQDRQHWFFINFLEPC